MVSVDTQFLESWLVEQRWFASKSRDLSAVNLLETLTLRESEEQPLVLALVEARFATGTHELYQVLLGARRETVEDEAGTIHEAGGWELYDAVGDPEQGGVLAGYFNGDREIPGEHGCVRFPRIGQWAYLLTLAPRGFFWFVLTPPDEDEGDRRRGQR